MKGNQQLNRKELQFNESKFVKAQWADKGYTQRRRVKQIRKIIKQRLRNLL